MYPPFYQPERVKDLYIPNLQASFEAGSAAFKKPISMDHPKVLAWLIDIQVDFVYPAPIGNLPVPHALEDTQRTIEWIYRNAHQVTQIAASLDTHYPLHIFYPEWWQRADGSRPKPYTVITAEEVKRGDWRATIDPAWSVHYVEELERIGKKRLMIWPYHCMEGSTGRALVPALMEAIVYHSGVRRVQPRFLTKGTIAETEFYSVLEPEVKYQRHPDGGLNTRFLDFLLEFDLIYVAGQARSHCVLETMNSVLRHFGDQPSVIEKLRFLNDCTSSILGFEADTEAAIKLCEARGVRLVSSMDAIR